jgi:hypothetical protein
MCAAVAVVRHKTCDAKMRRSSSGGVNMHDIALRRARQQLRLAPSADHQQRERFPASSKNAESRIGNAREDLAGFGTMRWFSTFAASTKNVAMGNADGGNPPGPGCEERPR